MVCVSSSIDKLQPLFYSPFLEGRPTPEGFIFKFRISRTIKEYRLWQWYYSRVSKAFSGACPDEGGITFFSRAGEKKSKDSTHIVILFGKLVLPTYCYCFKLKKIDGFYFNDVINQHYNHIITHLIQRRAFFLT